MKKSLNVNEENDRRSDTKDDAPKQSAAAEVSQAADATEERANQIGRAHV